MAARAVGYPTFLCAVGKRFLVLTTAWLRAETNFYSLPSFDVTPRVCLEERIGFSWINSLEGNISAQ